MKVGGGGVPLTHDARRVSRQLRTELQSVTSVTRKMCQRVEQAQVVVSATLRQLQGTAHATRARLDQNPRMVKAAMEGDSVQRPIVNAMEKLAGSAERSAAMLVEAEAALGYQQALLEECVDVLNAQWGDREASLQSAAGGLAAASGPVLDDQATHAYLADAAAKEDSARNAINKSLALARDAASKLEQCKSAVQVSVRTSRSNVDKAKRAQRKGNFGSSGSRETNPAARKMHLDPESKGHDSW